MVSPTQMKNTKLNAVLTALYVSKVGKPCSLNSFQDSEIITQALGANVRDTESDIRTKRIALLNNTLLTSFNNPTLSAECLLFGFPRILTISPYHKLKSIVTVAIKRLDAESKSPTKDQASTLIDHMLNA
ncbi:TPA: hypothetical protein ACGF9M_003669 [Vibrio cholerae]|uniref:hypothetical protein n=1 Tax=Vibrio cholerae TaxID=666 RepID=UPI0011595CBD|nr:hypothetical protein [Vibrio cholerae]TQP61992.1 hypothetical protein FLL76_16270 [Vibrio cholerae]TQP92326.1 hypothetical protein FLL73_18660 [Vibrio cholerae]TQQ12096.1 hypothetical protein FLL68_15875 [Vibrio cholerae]HAS3612498.1 hypothetical protein [Vibrio cholerae]